MRISERSGSTKPVALATLAAMTLAAVAALPLTAEPAQAAPQAGAGSEAASDEIVNVALGQGENSPTLDVSYDTSWNNANAINDGDSAATNNYSKMWGTWGAPSDPDTDTATYTWDNPVTISRSTLYLWQNLGIPDGDGGVMIPDSWSLEYLDEDGEWTEMHGADLSYPLPTLDSDQPAASQPAVEATFDEVTTTAVRLNLERTNYDGEKRATSVIEWQVWGTQAPLDVDEPEDPDSYIDSEAISVRTEPGQLPDLPDQAWVIDSSGPLHYVDVDWEDIDAEQVSEPGTFQVAGEPAGYDGAEIDATVYVATDLATDIESVDYVATITAPGVKPELPRTVVAHYSDETVSSTVGVDWEAIDPSSYADDGALFDVAGTVEGYSPGAIATVFVVSASQDGAPVVAIDFDSRPQGSGWYTSEPSVTVSAQEAGSPIASIEYSLDEGNTWAPYDRPFKLSEQGEVTVQARATSEDGEVGTQQQTVKVDTQAPTTAIDYVIEDDGSATVTLTPTDPEPGSGVTRTVWSDGPDKDPSSENNNMFATYEKPFSVQLDSDPRYVHVQSQDAAGNIESYVSLKLPAAGGEALTVEATPRCVGGQAMLYIGVHNDTDAKLTGVTAESDLASSALKPIAADHAGAVVQNSRAKQFDAGSVSVTDGSGEIRGTADYAALDCS